MALVIQLIPIAVFLFFSALLSGSETAFFNISRRQTEKFRSSGNNILNLCAFLLDSPKQLLMSLLFGNMAVNVIYTAASSILSINIGRTFGAASGGAAAVTAFVFLLMFGEIVPKSLAYSHSQKFCMFAAPFCYVLVRVLTPILKIFDFTIVSPIVRFFAGPIGQHSSEAVTANQLISLIDSSRQSGHITADENRLFTEVVELGFLKVRNVMEPRVDMVACDAAVSNKKMQKIMIDNNLTRIPVYLKEIDNIKGVVSLRNLMLNPQKKPSQMIETITFVPEQKTVESLLEFFRKSKTDMAVVVDEYGGIAGSVSLEHIIEELIGPLEPSEQVEAVEKIAPMTYRLAGDLPIHEWGPVFGIETSENRISTIGGLAIALIGKIPKPGDKAEIKNLTITVEKMHNRRIETLILSLKGTSK